MTPQSTNIQFLKFISYLQTIGIILVVAGHSIHEYPDGCNGTSTLFYQSLYSFRMPLFMFVSGFLMIYTTNIVNQPKLKPSAFIYNKIKRLLLPFAVLTLLTFVPRTLMSAMADDAIQLNAQTFLLAFLDNKYMPIPFFWFLQASFILLTFTFTSIYLLQKVAILIKISVIVLFCAFLLFYFCDISTSSIFSINEVKRLGLFFVLGCIYCVFRQKVDSLIPWTKWYLLMGSALLWIISYFIFQKTEWIIICSLFGIIMCISLAKIIEWKDWHFLDHLRGANYMIFLLSWFCNVASQQILAQFTDFPWWIYSVLSLSLGVYIPWLIYKYLERHQQNSMIRSISFLLGQSFRKD